MSPLALRILDIFINHAKVRNKNDEHWYENSLGYIASWTLGEMLDGDATTIQAATVHHNPGNEYELALRELIDLGLVREMPKLGERFELIVKTPKKAQEKPTVTKYWSYPPNVQGELRKKIDLEEQLSDL